MQNSLQTLSGQGASLGDPPWAMRTSAHEPVPVHVTVWSMPPISSPCLNGGDSVVRSVTRFHALVISMGIVESTQSIFCLCWHPGTDSQV